MNTNFYLPEDDSDESLQVQELAMQFTVSLTPITFSLIN